TPQLGDVESQAPFLDRQVRPDLGHQLALADDLAGAADQHTEKIECAAANLRSRTIAFQQAGPRHDAEGSAGKRLRDDFSLNIGPSSIDRLGNIDHRCAPNLMLIAHNGVVAFLAIALNAAAMALTAALSAPSSPWRRARNAGSL